MSATDHLDERWGRPPTPAFDEALLAELRGRLQAAPATRRVPSRGARGRGLRRSAVAAAAITVAAVGAGLAGEGWRIPAQPRGDHPPSFSALAAPPTPASRRVTARYDGNPLAEVMGMDVHGIRPAGPEGSGLFIAPTRRGWVCLIRTSPPVAGCHPERLLAERPMANRTYPRRGRQDIAGIAPDGYTRASFDGVSVPVARNGFLLEAVRRVAGTLVLTGPGVKRLSLGLEGTRRPNRA